MADAGLVSLAVALSTLPTLFLCFLGSLSVGTQALFPPSWVTSSLFEKNPQAETLSDVLEGVLPHFLQALTLFPYLC